MATTHPELLSRRWQKPQAYSDVSNARHCAPELKDRELTADAPRTRDDGVPDPDRGTNPEFETTRSAEDDDFEKGLTALSHLATGRMRLEDTLLQVAHCAARAIPRTNGVGLTLIEKGRADTIVATEPFVADMDAVQYGLKQGPGISAVTEQQTIVSRSLASDIRWPDFGRQSAGFGVQSSLSIPLTTSDGVVGCMNLYAHGTDVFDNRAALLGASFAIPAGIAVENAQILAESKRLALHLRTALNNRITVERAVGILMSRTGDDADQAHAKIRMMSQTEHKKVNLVAQGIVDTAVRAAQARHTS
jgi:GAF domain-containing protein